MPNTCSIYTLQIKSELSRLHVYQALREKTEVAIKNVQSRETDNIRYTRRRKTKQNNNTICVGHQYTKTQIM